MRKQKHETIFHQKDHSKSSSVLLSKPTNLHQNATFIATSSWKR